MDLRAKLQEAMKSGNDLARDMLRVILGETSTRKARTGTDGKFRVEATDRTPADIDHLAVFASAAGHGPGVDLAGAGLIDPSRIAMTGHSAGGAAAIAAMLADSRVRAGIDMDGATQARIPDHGLSRPFLFLGKQSNYTREAKVP